MILYSVLGLSGSEIRATSMATSIFSQTILLISCLLFGVIELSLWKLYATSICVVLFGTSLGNTIHHQVNTAQIILVLQLLILLSTLPLLQPNTRTVFGIIATTAYAIAIVLTSAAMLFIKCKQRAATHNPVTPLHTLDVK